MSGGRDHIVLPARDLPHLATGQKRRTRGSGRVPCPALPSSKPKRSSDLHSHDSVSFTTHIRVGGIHRHSPIRMLHSPEGEPVKVTIIVAVHNGEYHIGRSIRSLLEQSMAKKEFEIL